MGLLEDAIREHLDLKRKHGAPEQELERQEVEALGPARRGSPQHEPADEAVHAGDAAVVEPAAPAPGDAPAPEPFGNGDTDHQEPLGDALAAEDPHATAPVDEHAELDAIEPAPVEETHPEPPLDEAAYDEPAYDEEPTDDGGSTVDQPTELFDVEGALAEETPPRGFPAQDDEELAAGDTPPRGFPAQDELDESREDDEADVLEDTPDFLQDAPEHDRLWFEQKPPRDFDFD
jgi:hypothetical protein